MENGSSPAVIARSRIGNACDLCKARKVKCDGRSPCGYCTRRQRPLACHFSPQRKRNARPKSPVHSGPSTRPTPQSTVTPPGTQTRGSSITPHVRTNILDVRHASVEDETEVPREARLVKDAQGKLVFIGDCAPLSFYQSVRQLVTSRVEPTAFAQQTSQPSVLQHSRTALPSHANGQPPKIRVNEISAQIDVYLSVTTGIADLFNRWSLNDAVTAWASSGDASSATAIVHYLVLAIGSQTSDEGLAQAFFDYAKQQAVANLGGDLNLETVQSFTLITLYMLRACQTNAAFIYLGIAARAAFAIGVHRTEANAMFGDIVGKQRDRLWKSLRVVDLYLSTSMGRPPATSDVDCTVPYRSTDEMGNELFDLLNAHVQILLIAEGVVVEIYSRRKISLAVTKGISGRLREWSVRWLKPLQDVTSSTASDVDMSRVCGACQVLSTYYYAVMLVSRPFLMYEAYRRLSDSAQQTPTNAPTPGSGKSKLADACIEAASLLVGSVTHLLASKACVERIPLLISWLFASSLALGLGLMSGFGRVLEKDARLSVAALERFAKSDSLAMQYFLIAKSLVTIATEHLENQDTRERKLRTESSSQLFGLFPGGQQSPHHERNTAPRCVSVSLPGSAQDDASHAMATQVAHHHDLHNAFSMPMGNQYGVPAEPSTAVGQLDLSLFDGLFEGMSDREWGGTNLFPVLEDGAPLDFANYF